MGKRQAGAWCDMDDAALAERFQCAGDPLALDALLQRYRRYARAKARGYFLIGGDADDVEQEALIGLYKAVRDFRPEHQVNFRAFAELCIKRQIITAIKSATRNKHQPLNSYLSISGQPADDEAGPLEAVLVGHGDDDPCDRVVEEETTTALQVAVDSVLSGLEVDVLVRYVEGMSYQQISDDLGRHTKAIDNAIQRIKRKLDRDALTEQTDLAQIA